MSVSVSFELIPPRKGFTKNELINTLSPLMEVKPKFVDVTTHRNDISLNFQGSKVVGISHSKHPSTLAVSSLIREHFKVPVIPHVICGGFSREETEDLLLDLHFLGFDKLFVLQGDKLSVEKQFVPHPEGNKFACDLMTQINSLNSGTFINPSIKGIKTNFTMGTACYPERFHESPNSECDLRTMVLKAKLGSKFFISQMCFDINKFLEFSTKVKSHPDLFDTELIPGIKVLSSQSQLTSIPRTFNVSLPEDLVRLFYENSYSELLVDYTTNYCKQLIANGFKHLHFFTMNSSLVLKVLENIL